MSALLQAVLGKRRWGRRVFHVESEGAELDAAALSTLHSRLVAPQQAQLDVVLERLHAMSLRPRGPLSVEAMLTRFVPAASDEALLALLDSERFRARLPAVADARAKAATYERDPLPEPTDAPALPDDVRAMLQAKPRRLWMLGAGISAAAGISPYRGAGSRSEGQSPLTAHALFKGTDGDEPTFLSLPYFLNNPDLVWAHVDALKHVLGQKRPTLAHRVIAALERGRAGPVAITQNVDGLEAKAGFEALHLHGRATDFQCQKDDAMHPRDERFNDTRFPICPDDGSLLKPGVVMFFEGIPGKRFDRALDLIAGADVLIEVGTSHTVYPASEFWKYARSKGKLVLSLNLESPAVGREGVTVLPGDAQAWLLSMFRALQPGEPTP